MKKSKSVSKILNSQVFRMIIGGAFIFIASMLYVPSVGTIRSLPLSALIAAAAFICCKNVPFNLVCSFIFPFCLMNVEGSKLTESLILSLIFALIALTLGYGLLYIRTGVKSKKGSKAGKKCIISGIILSAVSLVVYTLICGNIFSAVLAKNKNSDYIKSNYGKDIEISYTALKPLTTEYKTYVKFKNELEAVGDRNDCYVSEIHDGIRDYYANIILDEGKKKLVSALTNAVDMLEVTACGIDFSEGEAIKIDAEYSDYGNRAWFVVSLYHTVQEKEQFARLCEKCVEALSKSNNTSFGKIIICGGSSSEVLYTLTIDANDFEVGDVQNFDEEYLKQYGVTEKKVLDYWYNR